MTHDLRKATRAFFLLTFVPVVSIGNVTSPNPAGRGSGSSRAKIYSIGLSTELTAATQDPDPVAADLAAAHKTGCCTAAQGLRVSSAFSTTVEGSRGSGAMGVMGLPAASFDLIAKSDLSALGGKGWAQPWLDQLARLKVRDSTEISSVVAIIGTRGLSSNSIITRELFDRYLVRLKSLTPDLIQRWRDVIRKSALPVSDLVLVHLLVAHDRLFTDSSEALRARELNRFRSIPAKALSAWTATTAIPPSTARSSFCGWTRSTLARSSTKNDLMSPYPLRRGCYQARLAEPANTALEPAAR